MGTSDTDAKYNESNPKNQEQCNGLTCFDKPTRKINVSAGIYGEISLNLCEKCISLFRDGKKLDKVKRSNKIDCVICRIAQPS